MPPAARIGDLHACPMLPPPLPPGPIVLGAPTVLIGFMPAARIGDACACLTAADPIIEGSSSVLINFMPAARLGDGTVNSGKVVTGMPTVMIG